ncbi:MAG: glycoside hydrolase family protein [Pseudohongiellaceae bacterium]
MADRLIEMLRRHEGVRNHVYRDTENLETIGVGRCIAEGSLGLSDDEVDYLLGNDLKRCIEELKRAFDWYEKLDPVRQDVMISLCFNLGLTRLLKFEKALAGMENSDWETASTEFMHSRWSTQVGQRAVELTDMLRTGKYQDG